MASERSYQRQGRGWADREGSEEKRGGKQSAEISRVEFSLFGIPTTVTLAGFSRDNCSVYNASYLVTTSC